MDPSTPRHHRVFHCYDVIMSAMASQTTSVSIVCLTVYSGADQSKHLSSASLAFVRGIHRWPVNSPHKGPVTRKMFPFDDVIMHNIRKKNIWVQQGRRDHFVYVPRQWGTTLHCYIVYYWLGTYTEWSPGMKLPVCKHILVYNPKVKTVNNINFLVLIFKCSWQISQNHWWWCPGSLRCQVISIHGID